MTLRQALDLVGKSRFGTEWLGVDAYDTIFDQTVRAAIPNSNEALRKAKAEYAPCREAAAELQSLLYGSSPRHGDAVPSLMITSSGRSAEIPVSCWGKWDTAMRAFQSGRIEFFAGAHGVYWSPTGGNVEGPVFVNEEGLRLRLADGTTGRAPESAARNISGRRDNLSGGDPAKARAGRKRGAYWPHLLKLIKHWREKTPGALRHGDDPKPVRQIELMVVEAWKKRVTPLPQPPLPIPPLPKETELRRAVKEALQTTI
jgi:hypothetical protein